MGVARMTATLLSTTPSSWSATAPTRPRATTGSSGTAGAPGGEKVATSGWPGTLRPSVALTPPQWTEQLVSEDLATMSSTCAASAASSSTSLILLELTTS